MTWVKICGMTNLEDALVAVDAGADAVGFVFYEKSPRCVTVEVAREIVAKLPEGVEKIGVFVSGSEPHWDRAIDEARLTGMQQYSLFEPDAPAGSANATGLAFFTNHLTSRFLPSLSIGDIFKSEGEIEDLARDFERLRNDGRHSLPEGMFDTFVLDSGSGRTPGGTGMTFDWARILPIAEGMRRGRVKMVVAGGLTSANVGTAIDILKPWGVDVVSGVEARPGKKDPDKVRAFVGAVREMDRRAS
jgi:phosphoribosylanthranilate isomerase